ncbi:MAG: ribonuclease J [Candidatus Parcubacteria bacterium]|nr:MAG: ribonuclease J [Candidatus Parcubacteria bacterium]
MKAKTQMPLKQYEGELKIIPLGGLEEVGRNMMALELNNKEIIIIDFGLGYPYYEEMPGIDFTIPNVEYLEHNKDKILGILITHGHYDHIGAIPYLIERIGNPPIYATPLAKGIILKRQLDFPNAPKLEIHEIKKDKFRFFQLGSFIINYFHVNHNIPDSIGYLIKTPVGNIIHTGDFKIDFSPFFDKPADLSRIVKLSLGGVRVLMVDSTNAFQSGFVASEKVIMENLETIFRKAQGRIIAATFASLLERIQQIVWLSGIYGRKVVLDGRTLKTNVEVAKALKYIQTPKGIFIKPEDSFRLPPNQVTIICTGSQAEEGSALMRIAAGEHKYFKIIPGDSVIFSSSVIPNNERIIQELKDDLQKQGANVFHYQMMDIHASGHAFSNEIKLLINLVKPEYVMPIHGHYFMMKATEEICLNIGMSKERVLLAQNGQIIKALPDKVFVSNEKVPANIVYVDGLSVGDVQEVVLRDRQNLANDGIFVVIVTIDSASGQLRTSPDIISRGFVYLRESKELLKEVRNLIRKIVDKHIRFSGEEKPAVQEEQIRYSLKEDIAEFLFKKTKRRPMVLPVVIKI